MSTFVNNKKKLSRPMRPHKKVAKRKTMTTRQKKWSLTTLPIIESNCTQSSEIERFVKLENSDIDNAIFTLKMICDSHT